MQYLCKKDGRCELMVFTNECTEERKQEILNSYDDYVELKSSLKYPVEFCDIQNGKVVYLKEKYEEQNRKEKLRKLRDIRDYILNKADWIQSYLDSEREAIANGFITEEQRRWSKDEIKSYLLWKQTLRDLPQTVDIDKLDINDIVETNEELFPPCPIKLKSQK
jgi:hypothetical protein